MTSGLQRRLLLLLLVPLFVLTALNAWFDYRLAGSAAVQQDRHLLSLVPMLADSVIARGTTDASPPELLTAPPVDEFLNDRPGLAAFAVLGLDGDVLVGNRWLDGPLPSMREPEFSSEEYDGVTYRIVSQRMNTAAGELVVRLADGSDTRQQWLHQIWLKVVLPNVVLVITAFFAVNWAVRRALRPLYELKEAVERRSPRDLSALDPQASPDEVRPLVLSLNRLFDLVNAQAESQARFVADAAHQLRTPLAGLQAQVEAWAQTVNRSGQADWRDRSASTGENLAVQGSAEITLSAEQINKLRSAARRTSQLANQLLALSRADASHMAGQPVHRVDLKDLCESVLALHLDAASAKGIDLGLEVRFAQVSGHEWLLRELLGNLVDNAVRYTAPGGTVTIRCGPLETRNAAGGAQVFLEVEDDGPGIPAAERARVLERFYRVPGTVGEGNGLGLAIADEIARAHRAQLTLEAAGSREGVASGLRVRLVMRSPA
ncbi:MAG: sensor histidine kinase N-terminal domain-containing protein [Polaromonas sp.]|nr:sensor histidine kinase N-terminal domain-containing protein [Polaromonas sp.]